MAITAEKINQWFGRHNIAGLPEAETESAEKVLLATTEAAHAIRRFTPPSSEQTHAINKLRESLDWARKALSKQL